MKIEIARKAMIGMTALTLSGCGAEELLDTLGVGDSADLLQLIASVQDQGTPEAQLAAILAQGDLAESVLSGVLAESQQEALTLIDTLLEQNDSDAVNLLSELLTQGEDDAIEAFITLLSQDDPEALRLRDQLLALNDGNPRTDLRLAITQLDTINLPTQQPPTPTPPTNPGTTPASGFNTLTLTEAEAYINTVSAQYGPLVGRISGLPQVGFEALTVTGTASYNGNMLLLLSDAENVTARPLGDLTMTVNLGSGDTTGVADNFVGSAVAPNQPTAAYVRYDGTISLSGGALLMTASDGEVLSFDINGTLNNGVNTFGVSGDMVAAAQGSDATALIGTGFGSTVVGQLGDRPEIGVIAVTVDGTAPARDLSQAQIWVEKTN